MNFQTRSDYLIEVWKVSNPNFSLIVRINFWTRFDYPIAIWQVSNPNFSRPFGWISNQVWLSNCDLTSVKSQFFPNRLDKFPNRVWLPNLRFDKCQIPIFLDHSDKSPDRVWLSHCDLISVKSQFFMTVWMNFQTGSDYPIVIFKSQFFPDRLDKFPNWVWLPNLWFDKCQIPIFSLTIWMNFQTGSDYPIAICQMSNPNFSLTVWMNFQTRSDYPIEFWQVSNPNFSLTVWMNF